MEKIELKDLTIKELIFIGLLKQNEKSDILGKLAQKDYFKRMYSYEEDSMKFLNNMYKRKVINVDAENSELINFTIKEDGYISYRPYCVDYYLNVETDIKEIDIKSEIKKRFDYEELEFCWIGICLDECMRYLDIRTTAMDLGIVDDLTRKQIYNYLVDILMEYPMGKVINILYKSVNYASNFKVEYNVDNEKVYKAIYTNIKNNVCKKYCKTSFERPYELEATSLYDYFCNNIFQKDGDEVFKNGISISEVYGGTSLNTDDNDTINKECTDTEETIRDGVEKYKNLVIQVKELAANKVPKDFIIDYLKITEEIYNTAIESSVEN